jgi:carboxypeptidase Taq
VFPEQLRNVKLDEFYNAINRVEPSLIRTDADEVTYNLHVMLRFELELDLLEGKLSIADLPSAWHERYLADLGVMAPDDRDGVLQDVHWYAGFIGGAFQGYTLGNIIGAQLFDAALRDTPEIHAQIGRGEYQPLHDWLRKNIYRIGRRRTPDQLIADVTGGPLDAKPLLNRLHAKFSTIYPG